MARRPAGEWVALDPSPPKTGSATLKHGGGLVSLERGRLAPPPENVESVKTRNERDRRGSLAGLQGTEVLVDEQPKASSSRPFFPSGSLDATHQQQQQPMTPTTEPEASAKPPERHQFTQLSFTAAPHPRPYLPPPPPVRSNPHPHPHFQFTFSSQGLPAPPPALPSPVGMARHPHPNSPPRSLPLLSLPTLPTPPEGTPYDSPRSIQTHPGFRSNGPPSAAAATVAAAAGREMALSFVKLFLVSHLRGFDVAEDPAVRDFLTACATPGFSRFMDHLTADDLRHYLFELYAATKMALVVDMRGGPDAALVAHAGVRHPGGIRGGTHGITPGPQRRAGSSFHASFEILNTATYDGGIGGESEGSGADGVISGSDTVQGEKYLCLRVHWLTQAFALRTASLAVRRWPRPILRPIDLEDGRIGFGDGGLFNSEDVGLNRWTRDVLEEHGVEIGRLFSTVTDVEGENGNHGGAGPAVGQKRRGRSSASGRVFARMSSAGVSWEWSIAHMLDTVLAEAFCISPSRCADGERGNTAARGIINCFQVLVTDLADDSMTCGCKTTFRGVHLATHGAYANRSNAFPFCWVTTMRVMEHTLASWTDLEDHYTHHRRSTISDAGGGATTSTARFPLANHRAAAEELYSVMKPIAAVIERTQGRSPPPTAGPTSITSLVDLATLRLTAAEPSKPLLVFLPHKVATAPSTTAAAGNVDAARVETRPFGESGACSITKVTRPVTDLNTATITTRELLRVALDKHFFGARYDENYKKREGQGIGGESGCGGGPSSSTENGLSGAGNPTTGEVDYIFEMASCMDPFLSQLYLVDSLASSPEHAAHVKSIIWEKVVAFAVSLAEAEEASTKSSEIHRRYDLGERFLPREPQQNGARGVAQSGAGDGGIDRQPVPTSCYQGHSALEGGGKKRSRLAAFGLYKGVHNSIHNGVQNGGGGSSSAGDARGALPESSPREDSAGNGRNFDVSYILESGLFGSAPTNPTAGATTHNERAEAELEAFKALGAKRTFGVPPLKELLQYWASEGAEEFPYLARAAGVLLAFPTSSLVGESEELRGAEDRLLGRRGGTSPGSPGSVFVVATGASSSGGSRARVGGIGYVGVGAGAGSVGGSLPRFSDQGYAEMALLLHYNRGGIPRQIPALGPEEALANAPRRWLERPAEDKTVYKRI